MSRNFALETLIIEGDTYAALELQSLVESAGYQVCGTLENASNILSAISQYTPDLIIANSNPNNVKALINLKNFIKGEIPILFSSGYHNRDSSDANYFTPPSEAVFRKTIKGLLRDTDSEIKIGCNKAFLRREYLYFIKKGVYYKVNVNEILFVKAIDDYSIIHTPDGEVVIFATLSKVTTLLQNYSFLQTHRSYLINEQKNSFFDISRDNIYIDSHQIPISRGKKKEVITRLKTTNVASRLAY